MESHSLSSIPAGVEPRHAWPGDEVGQLTVPRFRPPDTVVRVLQLLAAAGAVTLMAGAFLAPDRVWANLWLAANYVMGLGLAAVFFVAVNYATGAGWSVAFRRIPEAISRVLPWAGAGLAVVLLFRFSIFPWSAGFPDLQNPALWFKRLWLTPSFFFARSAAYVLLWTWFARRLVQASRRQDLDGSTAHTLANVRRSAAFLVVFAITCWLASYDWIMSLEPDWSSTIFGIYYFSGLFLSGLAAMTVLVIWLYRLGPLRHILTPDHLHDLGNLMFAFSSFWMYIWFSQYMLIWYAHIPEETSYFVHRLKGFWEPLFLLNFLLNWAVPFLILLHVRAKRNHAMLLKICWVLLVGRWVDLYLMVMPRFAGGNPVFGVWEAGVMCGAAAVFFLVVFRALGEAPMVPLRDPYLVESLHLPDRE